MGVTGLRDTLVQHVGVMGLRDPLEQHVGVTGLRDTLEQHVGVTGLRDPLSSMWASQDYVNPCAACGCHGITWSD